MELVQYHSGVTYVHDAYFPRTRNIPHEVLTKHFNKTLTTIIVWKLLKGENTHTQIRGDGAWKQIQCFLVNIISNDDQIICLRWLITSVKSWEIILCAG